MLCRHQPTGRRGIAIFDVLLVGNGGDSCGIGGRGECNDKGIEGSVGGLSLVIGGGADGSGGSGTPGKALENLERPLPGGALGNIDSISV